MLQPRAPWHPGQQCAGGLLTRRWCLPPPGAPRDGQCCVARSAGAPPAPRSAISLPAPHPDKDPAPAVLPQLPAPAEREGQRDPSDRQPPPRSHRRAPTYRSLSSAAALAQRSEEGGCSPRRSREGRDLQLLPGRGRRERRKEGLGGAAQSQAPGLERCPLQPPPSWGGGAACCAHQAGGVTCTPL